VYRPRVLREQLTLGLEPRVGVPELGLQLYYFSWKVSARSQFTFLSLGRRPYDQATVRLGTTRIHEIGLRSIGA
jgi:hypothetical protein